MITIDGIEYMNGTRVPVQPIREMVKKHMEEERTILDDDLPDWEQEHDLTQQIADYINGFGIIPNDQSIENIIKEVQV